METTIRGYSVKNIIEDIGHDGQGLECNLYLDNKKVAHVSYDGWGGMCYEYLFDDPQEKLNFQQTVLEETEIKRKNWEPKNELEKEMGFMYGEEMFIEDLISKYNLIKTFKQLCKTGVIFQVGKDIGTNTYSIMKGVSYLSNSVKIDKLLETKYTEPVLIWNKELRVN